MGQPKTQENTKMTKQTKEKPAAEIRLGRIKATVWRNQTEQGERFNTTYTKLYRVGEGERDGPKDNGWRETQSFGREENLLLGKLADQVHSWIHEQASQPQ